MQINYLYLYSNRIDAYTSASTPWTAERYRQVYNRNLKFYQDVNNRIDIQVRNGDEKAINVSGSSMVFNLISRDTEKLVLQKDCVTVDASIGRFYVEVTEAELFDIESGFYEYSIVQELREAIDADEYRVTRRTPMYIDSQYGTKSVIELLGGTNGDVNESLVVNKFDYTNPAATGDEDPAFYTSSIIDARPNVTTVNSLHTFQLYSTNYNGTVVIQGSIDDQGASPNTWSDLLSFSPENDLEYKNIEGKYTWFRVKHIPNVATSIAEFIIRQTVLGSYEVGIDKAGTNYNVGDVITISGNELGGETPANDLTITVLEIDSAGRISSIDWSGVSYAGVRSFVKSGNLPSAGTVDKILYR